MEADRKSVAILCPACGLMHAYAPLPEGMIAKCTRCGATITRRTTHSMHLTAAFALAALILYVPANVFPILQLNMYGATTDNTVWQGCRRLFIDGDYVIAVIVFLASILIPFFKLLGLLLLTASTKLQVERWKRPRFWLYQFIDVIGRWAMLDVFVMAVLVSLVKLRRLATIIPGPGLLAFSLVVVFTILASTSFDPHLIWDREESEP